ncbi:2-dehydro-3-deoxy-6-phosphogalactonate aldolase [Arthrobacter sp. MYb211]|uniref:2-dehydro-3-deoxy-6-phosphogalactonate aldolase n=1 Tax=Micrococcaceae TaxID=1268 RepID=UPI000CFDE6E0|nr:MULTISPECIES: 2-dehydro-3-deoxy-6-phosphogalactonate aldolase [unclassified Arthrobacter]PRA04367.1 2-dehydro-3-deoxy-6-phosphogalactonate aldolase [Arthrobacter sp. MYb229]PRA10216.1 2-dehydro-3-deoxy-6-phosphogalactonate aldolase [Arthrobacter sp. MYb221]PRB51719.1 2-dehydro-3-deoxy-6-phosphogalactonate aldolase [Arthrobacter sp. MYb216]PRC05595.1 2-dehydro-3-deoxy-6-phosphogalactonate aldolase [Arthrobacter sp. MYb211]
MNETPSPLHPSGLVAILRGLDPAQAQAVGESLYASGFRALEVPLNSPEPLKSIEILRRVLPADAVVGAGTVLTVSQVRACHGAGSQIIVSPNTNLKVIEETVALGMDSFPGAATPSNAFDAIEAGAQNVKIFPAEQVGLVGFKAWTAVIPKEIRLLPVGGITEENMQVWAEAGATGFGIGSSLYKAGRSLEDLKTRADKLVHAYRTIHEMRKSA